MKCLCSDEISTFASYLSNPLHSIFGLNFKSTNKCTVCFGETQRETYESIWSISIDFQSDLRNALASYCSVTTLDGDDSVECFTCKKRIKTVQFLKLAGISATVFIHLKRFRYDVKSESTNKLLHFVSYPELLDLKPYLDNKVFQSNYGECQSRSIIYQLYAVLSHRGRTPNSGHIYSYVFSPDNHWYLANDEKLSPVDLNVVLNDENAYVLCYVKSSKTKSNYSPVDENSSNHSPVHAFLTSTPEDSPSEIHHLIRTDSSVKMSFLE